MPAKKKVKLGKPIVVPPVSNRVPDPVNTAPEVPEVSKEEKRQSRLIQKPESERVSRVDNKIPEYDPMYQKLFEAPDGAIMVGEKTAGKMWYQQGQIFILPRRVRITPDERAAKQLQK